MTRLDYKLVFIIGPLLSIATLWAFTVVPGVPDKPLPWSVLAVACLPALAGVGWGVSRRPSIGRALALLFGVASVTFGLLLATIILQVMVTGVP